MKGDVNLDLKKLPELLKGFMRKIGAYRVFLFFLLVAGVYGFIVWRINVLSNAPASQSEINAQTSAQPHIDSATIQKIQNLQDNSVNVQSLFDDARNNPFQE